jgi:pimeloyl-ACP methyl ester carboxylesterase
VSYGGLIATEFAARRPERVAGLVLASALHSTWQPNPRQQRFLHSPRLLSPLFVATAPGRMNPEVTAAIPSVGARLRFKAAQSVRVAFAMASPSKMARRVEWARAHRFADPHAVKAPALIVTGEPGLDNVVPVDVSRRYLDELESAQHVVLQHTGHIGLVTRPEAFADVLGRFVNGVRLSA